MLLKIQRYNCQNDRIWVMPQYLFWRWLGHFPSTGSISYSSKFWLINSLLLLILIKRTSWISDFTSLLSEMKTNCIRTSALGSIIFLISKFLVDISFLVFLFSYVISETFLAELLLCRCPNSYVLLLWLWKDGTTQELHSVRRMIWKTQQGPQD